MPLYRVRRFQQTSWTLLGVVACTQGGASVADVTALDASALDASAADAAASAADPSAEDASAECPADDPFCATGGYAHFVISNVAGSGLPNEATYDVSAELITDTVTKLVWQRVVTREPMGFDEARDYCTGLELGGRSDFRVPQRIELVTLLDFDELPVITSVFDDVVADYHWTSSLAWFVQGSAYTVYFGAGETTIADASPGRANVRCVAARVEQPPTPRFVKGDGWTKDEVTGLTWETRAAAPATFDESGERCAALDMRLPSVRELQSLVDESAHAPALDLRFFEGELNGLTWTSTLRGSRPWTVDFSDGKTYADASASDALESRCVR